MKQHEDTCEYAVVACPNSNSEICGLHRRQSLQKHIDSCQHVPCPHRNKGCTVHQTDFIDFVAIFWIYFPLWYFYCFMFDYFSLLDIAVTELIV